MFSGLLPTSLGAVSISALGTSLVGVVLLTSREPMGCLLPMRCQALPARNRGYRNLDHGRPITISLPCSGQRIREIARVRCGCARWFYEYLLRTL
eukprot:jgi/Mesvir1/21411/Mv25935-RA.1